MHSFGSGAVSVSLDTAHCMVEWRRGGRRANGRRVAAWGLGGTFSPAAVFLQLLAVFAGASCKQEHHVVGGGGLCTG